MHEMTRQILEQFPVRKGKKRKTAFLEWLTAQLEKEGYQVDIQSGGGARNLVLGDVAHARYAFCAHYDTPARLPFPNFITPKSLVALILYQLALLMVFMAIMIGIEVGVTLLSDNLMLGLSCGVVSMVVLMAQMLAGIANPNNANDNTSGVLTVLEAALALPRELRGEVAFVLFDNEELGLVGSQAMRKRYGKKIENTTFINFDCVGVGDSLHLCMTRQSKKDAGFDARLEKAFVTAQEGKTVTVERGFFFYPSDQMNFTRGVGVCALKRGKRMRSFLYLDDIHTARDTKLDERNVAQLAEGVVRLASGE